VLVTVLKNGRRRFDSFTKAYGKGYRIGTYCAKWRLGYCILAKKSRPYQLIPISEMETQIQLAPKAPLHSLSADQVNVLLGLPTVQTHPERKTQFPCSPHTALFSSFGQGALARPFSPYRTRIPSIQPRLRVDQAGVCKETLCLG
jgi:hypothetical protein